MSDITDRITEVLRDEGLLSVAHAHKLAERIVAELVRPIPWEPDPDWIKK